MAKATIIKEKGTGAELYPHTSARLVHTSRNSNVDDELAAKEGVFTLSDDLRMSEKRELSVADKAKMAVFIDMWNNKSGKHGRYNERTGFFELNGLTDITYEEAMTIYANTSNFGKTRAEVQINLTGGCRTNFMITAHTLGASFNCSDASKLEVLAMESTHEGGGYAISAFSIGAAPILREVRGAFVLKSFAANNFENLPSLEEIRIGRLNRSISFARSPKLTLESVAYMVDNAANTTTISITVHPDVYAKLTDEGNAEWYPVLTAGLDKNISFATV